MNFIYYLIKQLEKKNVAEQYLKRTPFYGFSGTETQEEQVQIILTYLTQVSQGFSEYYSTELKQNLSVQFPSREEIFAKIGDSVVERVKDLIQNKLTSYPKINEMIQNTMFAFGQGKDFLDRYLDGMKIKLQNALEQSYLFFSSYWTNYNKEFTDKDVIIARMKSNIDLIQFTSFDDINKFFETNKEDIYVVGFNKLYQMLTEKLKIQRTGNIFSMAAQDNWHLMDYTLPFGDVIALFVYLLCVNLFDSEQILLMRRLKSIFLSTRVKANVGGLIYTFTFVELYHFFVYFNYRQTTLSVFNPDLSIFYHKAYSYFSYWNQDLNLVFSVLFRFDDIPLMITDSNFSYYLFHDSVAENIDLKNGIEVGKQLNEYLQKIFPIGKQAMGRLADENIKRFLEIFIIGMGINSKNKVYINSDLKLELEEIIK
jgi:hypothetical protein